MGKDGKIVWGSPDVEANGARVARRLDLNEHGGRIAEGSPTVVANSIAIARVGDRFPCAMVESEPHVGGRIMSGASTVYAGGELVARVADPTLCWGLDGVGNNLDGIADPSAGPDAASATSECAKLWAAVDREAKDVIDPAGDDHRKRNHIINGAYADLYLRNPDFAWAGLAAYASKQVGCAMDHAQMVMSSPRMLVPGAYPMAKYTYEMLGMGNRDLFLDIYPMHRFFEKHGWEKFAHCASSRTPPVPAAALDGFRALDQYKRTGDKKYLKRHLEALAYHEQVEILQTKIYNDTAMRKILDANEGNIDDLPPSIDLPSPLASKLPRRPDINVDLPGDPVLAAGVPFGAKNFSAGAFADPCTQARDLLVKR